MRTPGPGIRRVGGGGGCRTARGGSESLVTAATGWVNRAAATGADPPPRSLRKTRRAPRARYWNTESFPPSPRPRAPGCCLFGSSPCSLPFCFVTAVLFYGRGHGDGPQLQNKTSSELRTAQRRYSNPALESKSGPGFLSSRVISCTINAADWPDRLHT